MAGPLELNSFYLKFVNHAVKMIIEGWKERYKFDELAFANYSFDGISTRVLEVQRLR